MKTKEESDNRLAVSELVKTVLVPNTLSAKKTCPVATAKLSPASIRALSSNVWALAVSVGLSLLSTKPHAPGSGAIPDGPSVRRGHNPVSSWSDP